MKKVMLFTVGVFMATACNNAADRIENSAVPASEEMMEALPEIVLNQNFMILVKSLKAVVKHTFTFIKARGL